MRTIALILTIALLSCRPAYADDDGNNGDYGHDGDTDGNSQIISGMPSGMR